MIPPKPNGTSGAYKRNESVFRTGHGRSIGQFGELFQGQIEEDDDRLRRCLLSLPCIELFSEVFFAPNGEGTLTVNPPHKKKAKRAVELALQQLNVPIAGGTITVTSNIPEAKGCGSSTADCIAGARAVADSVNCTLTEEEIACLVVQAEVASDNIMFGRAVLFAHREGVVLEDYQKKLPSIEVLGVDTARDDTVKTLEFPPAHYSWRQRQSFHTMKAALRRAFRERDADLLGRVATASACINQLFLPKPMFHEIRRVAETEGALGISVAHSGTVMGILLDPRDPLLDHRIEAIQNDLNQLGIPRWLRFQT